MANTVRIKRRAAGGAAGAPASLQNAELAFNEQDLTLYYGLGTGGAGGSATSVIPIAGTGAFVGLTGNQTIAGTKTFSSAIVGDITGNAGTVTNGLYSTGSYANPAWLTSLAWSKITGTPTTLAGYSISDAVAKAGSTMTGVLVHAAGSATVAGGVQLTSGTLKTTPVVGDSGSIEYDGTAVYIINSAAARKTIAFIDGNVASATKLQTARTINGVSFDGTANITVTANTTNTLTAGSYLTGGTFNGSGAVTFAVDATNLNTASKIVARDASGNFSAGTITAALAGNATTATALQTARSISATGDATWTVNFDGSANATAALTLANSGVTAGTYTKVTVDAKGRVTTGAALATADLPTTLQTNSYAPGLLGSVSATVAAAGTTQGTATVLTSDYNVVTSATAGSATGVVVPGATSGKYVVVVNRTAVAINVYPASGHAFDGLAVNTPISVPAGGFLEYFGTSTTQWHSTYQAIVQGQYVVGAVSTANALATARAIALSGDATGTANFDGSAGITIATTLANSGVTAGTYSSVTVDAKGRVTAGTNPGYLTSNQSITVSGDASGSGTTAITLTLANSGVTAGTYPKVTVDAKGRVTAGTTLAATDIPTLTASKISDFDTQVRLSRLDQMAAPTAAVSLNSQRITNLADPVGAQDAATKNYVDMSIQGLDPKQSVAVASTGNIASLSGLPVIDGYAVQAGDRVLVKDQTTASQNGVYIASSTAWARAADLSTWDEHVNAYLFVQMGVTNYDIGYLCNVNKGGILGTTAINFVQFTGAGQIIAGNGMTKTGNTLDVGTASASRIVVNADNIDLATIGTAGTYRSVTVDAYGRVSAGTNPTTLAGYGITDAQALDATLTALAGLVTAADQMIYSTGVDTFSMTALTAYGRSLVGAADAGAARTTLGLGSMATQSAGGVAITGGSISNLTTFDGITIDGGTF